MSPNGYVSSHTYAPASQITDSGNTQALRVGDTRTLQAASEPVVRCCDTLWNAHSRVASLIGQAEASPRSQYRLVGGLRIGWKSPACGWFAPAVAVLKTTWLDDRKQGNVLVLYII